MRRGKPKDERSWDRVLLCQGMLVLRTEPHLRAAKLVVGLVHTPSQQLIERCVACQDDRLI